MSPPRPASRARVTPSRATRVGAELGLGAVGLISLPAIVTGAGGGVLAGAAVDELTMYRGSLYDVAIAGTVSGAIFAGTVSTVALVAVAGRAWGGHASLGWTTLGSFAGVALGVALSLTAREVAFATGNPGNADPAGNLVGLASYATLPLAGAVLGYEVSQRRH